MIDLSKRYKTRRGGEVVGLTEHNCIILGWEIYEDSHKAHTWFPNGLQNFTFDLEQSPYDLIEVDEKEELLEEALRRYPNGTNFLTVDGDMLTSTGQMSVSPNNEVFVQCTCMSHYNVYLDGQWAEIVKEHTVEVYFYGGVDGILLATTVEAPNHIAKKKITFYEGEGI